MQRVGSVVELKTRPGGAQLLLNIQGVTCRLITHATNRASMISANGQDHGFELTTTSRTIAVHINSHHRACEVCGVEYFRTKNVHRGSAGASPSRCFVLAKSRFRTGEDASNESHKTVIDR